MNFNYEHKISFILIGELVLTLYRPHGDTEVEWKTLCRSYIYSSLLRELVRNLLRNQNADTHLFTPSNHSHVLSLNILVYTGATTQKQIAAA